MWSTLSRQRNNDRVGLQWQCDDDAVWRHQRCNRLIPHIRDTSSLETARSSHHHNLSQAVFSGWTCKLEQRLQEDVCVCVCVCVCYSRSFQASSHENWDVHQYVQKQPDDEALDPLCVRSGSLRVLQRRNSYFDGPDHKVCLQ